MPNKQQITELLIALGWKDLGKQKNQYMISFLRDGVRMNIYHTTMTTTVQSPYMDMQSQKECTLEDIEKLAIKDYDL